MDDKKALKKKDASTNDDDEEDNVNDVTSSVCVHHIQMTTTAKTESQSIKGDSTRKYQMSQNDNEMKRHGDKSVGFRLPTRLVVCLNCADAGSFIPLVCSKEISNVCINLI